MRIEVRQDSEVQIDANAHPASMNKDSVNVWFDNHLIRITHVDGNKLMIQEQNHSGLCIQTLGSGGILLKPTIGE